MQISPVGWGKRLFQGVTTGLERLSGAGLDTAPDRTASAEAAEASAAVSTAPKGASAAPAAGSGTARGGGNASGMPVWTVGVYRRGQQVRAMRYARQGAAESAAYRSPAAARLPDVEGPRSMTVPARANAQIAPSRLEALAAMGSQATTAPPKASVADGLPEATAPPIGRNAPSASMEATELRQAPTVRFVEEAPAQGTLAPPSDRPDPADPDAPLVIEWNGQTLVVPGTGDHPAEAARVDVSLLDALEAAHRLTLAQALKANTGPERRLLDTRA